MEEMLTLTTIEQVDRLFGTDSKNRYVALTGRGTPHSIANRQFFTIFYGVFIVRNDGFTINYGGRGYEIRKGSIIANAPDQVICFNAAEDNPPQISGVVFHPELTRNTSLVKKIISSYEFLNYSHNKALYPSDNELAAIEGLMEIVRNELRHPADEKSLTLLASTIELLLDNCQRVYDRQFRKRNIEELSTIDRFEYILNDYLFSGLARQHGVPTVEWCADKLCLNPNYFGDMLKRRTGHSPKYFIQTSMLGFAKEFLHHPDKSVEQVAEMVGFQHVQNFIRFFQRHTGVTPSKYRKAVFRRRGEDAAGGEG